MRTTIRSDRVHTASMWPHHLAQKQLAQMAATFLLTEIATIIKAINRCNATQHTQTHLTSIRNMRGNNNYITIRKIE